MTSRFALAALAAAALASALAGGCADDGAPRAAAVEPARPAPAAACEGGAAPAAPPKAVGFAVGDRAPSFEWDGEDEAGRRARISLARYEEPCAARPRLLVVRVHGGAWCGTCRWHAEHTSDLFALPEGDRLRVLDVVVSDRDGSPARAEDLAAFRGLVDPGARARVAFAVDPAMELARVAPASGVPVPLYVFVDTRTLSLRGYLSNPNPDELADRVGAIVAELDRRPAPARREPALVDGLFHADEWDMIRGATGLGAPPPDPTNDVADSAAAAALGKALFFDAGLSPGGAVACATCHDPAKQLSDGAKVARGAGLGSRRTPRIALAAHARWQGWDGRADTLWSQALLPLEHPDEMGGSRLFVVRRVAERWAREHAAAFPGRPLPDVSRLPAEGKPGDAAFEALPPATKEAVTRAFVDVGKAIAAYERTFRVAENRFDRYARGDAGALTPLEKQGLLTFMHVGCMQCHWGPRLTDDAFHVTRMASGHPGAADRGRELGAAILGASELTRAGRFSDAPSPLLVRPGAPGAFKTPALRGVAGGGPFGHGGESDSLSSVTELYGRGGLPDGDPRTIGALEPWLLRFDEAAQWGMPPFLATLTAEPIVP
ncbi:MAG: cytochrome-c peroxidase [Myxococcales bacterium]|nr:cytochrome-c peroxidase [Myxococcales bacterium]